MHTMFMCKLVCFFHRLFDSDKVQSLVTKWVGFYKTYREILTSDIVHVRRPDMQGNQHTATVITPRACAGVKLSVRPSVRPLSPRKSPDLDIYLGT